MVDSAREQLSERQHVATATTAEPATAATTATTADEASATDTAATASALSATTTTTKTTNTSQTQHSTDALRSSVPKDNDDSTNAAAQSPSPVLPSGEEAETPAETRDPVAGLEGATAGSGATQSGGATAAVRPSESKAEKDKKNLQKKSGINIIGEYPQFLRKLFSKENFSRSQAFS